MYEFFKFYLAFRGWVVVLTGGMPNSVKDILKMNGAIQKKAVDDEVYPLSSPPPPPLSQKYFYKISYNKLHYLNRLLIVFWDGTK